MTNKVGPVRGRLVLELDEALQSSYYSETDYNALQREVEGLRAVLERVQHDMTLNEGGTLSHQTRCKVDAALKAAQEKP